jgi:hypothetical protein
MDISYLKSRKLNFHIIIIINKLNIDNSTFIKKRNNFSKKISTGIRQVDNLSPILLIIDEIIKKVKEDRGYMENKEVKIVCYATDIEIFEDEDSVHKIST